MGDLRSSGWTKKEDIKCVNATLEDAFDRDEMESAMVDLPWCGNNAKKESSL